MEGGVNFTVCNEQEKENWDLLCFANFAAQLQSQWIEEILVVASSPISSSNSLNIHICVIMVQKLKFTLTKLHSESHKGERPFYQKAIFSLFNRISF